MATPPATIQITAQMIKEKAHALELAAAAGSYAESGDLISQICGDCSRILLALADIDAATAHGVQAQIAAINEDVFGEVGRADLQRDHAYDYPKSLKEDGEVADTPQEMPDERQRTRHPAGGPIGGTTGTAKKGDEDPAGAASTDSDEPGKPKKPKGKGAGDAD